MGNRQSQFPASLREVSGLVRTKSVSPVELTQDSLARIESLYPKLNAFITITADHALAQARQAESEILRDGWRGPLHGIPLGIKDLIDTAGIRTTAGSAVFEQRIPAEDAEVVRRLLQAGAVILGKQNLHEFAYGGSSLVSAFGVVHNPWNLDHIAGGSSGGSAAAVAASIGFGAIGTDTAGSVREPAALCGVVGLKPTYGRVSVHGVIPLSPSLDHVGPITRTVADAAIMLQAIAGHDARDPLCAEIGVDDYSADLETKINGLRIGIPTHYFYDELDGEVAAAMAKALAALGSLGAAIRDVELQVPTDRRLQAAESFVCHAKLMNRNRALYQSETLRRIESGRGISDSEQQSLREELARTRNEVKSVFEHVDLLVTPTTPVAAPSITELMHSPDALRPAEINLLRNTRPFNVWGLPAISVPCGFTRAGLPIGLQIAGPHWGEARVLQAAAAYERATAWHERPLPEL